MVRYLVWRLIQTIPVLFVTSLGVWFMIYLVPGDPATVLLGPEASAEQVRSARQRMGLDEPLPVQYTLWLGRAVRGDLGKSYLNDTPVRDLLRHRIPVTLHLALATTLVAPTVGLPLGIVLALRPRSWVSRAAAAYNAAAMAVPAFWLGILLVLIVGLQLKWLPTSGYVPIWDNPGRSLRLLILPTLTLSAQITAMLARFTEAAILEILDEDYVRTARAKGLREQAVVGVHVLRNALIPVVTVLGLQFGTLMGGAVLTESIFGYPGLGRMLVEAIFQRDYAVVQGTILVVVSAYVLINLLTDLAYAWLDPRIRYVPLR